VASEEVILYAKPNVGTQGEGDKNKGKGSGRIEKTRVYGSWGVSTMNKAVTIPDPSIKCLGGDNLRKEASI